MKLLIPPPIQAILAGILMWFIAKGLPDLTIALAGQKTVAACIMGLGILLDLTAVSRFIRERTTINPMAPHRSEHLVTSGLNRISRNPMYLGMVLLLTGWAVWLGAPLALLCVAGFVFVITELQIKPEEKVLQEKFGAAYCNYTAKVRRWL